MHTEIGRIASLTQELKDEKSPLQREIETITRVITIIAVAMGVLFFFLGMFVGKLSLAAAFLFTIGIIVANVPEGLLPTVSLSLAMAVQRMVAQERADQAAVLRGNAGLHHGYLQRQDRHAHHGRDHGHEDLDERQTGHRGRERPRAHRARSRTRVRRFLTSRWRGPGCIASSTHPFSATTRPSGPRGSRASIGPSSGDPTEAALLVMAAKGGFDIPARSKALPRIGHLPFEAVRKRMTTVNLRERHAGRPREGRVLRRCSSSAA